MRIEIFTETTQELEIAFEAARKIQALRDAEEQTANAGFTSEPIERVVTDVAAIEQRVVAELTPIAVKTESVKPASESDAADALRELIASKGAAVAVQVLGEFGVKRAGELAPEQRGAFVDRARTV